jgi:biotin operon repressor
MMKYKINGKICQMESERILTLEEASDAIGVDFVLLAQTKASYEDIMFKVIGFSTELDVFLIEPKLRSPTNRETFNSIQTDQTREEQLQAFSPDELATFVNLSNKRFGLKKKQMIFEVSLMLWLDVIGRDDLIRMIDHHEAEIVHILFEANEPLHIEEIAEEIGCDIDAALKLIRALQRIGQVDTQNSQGKTLYTLAQYIHDQMTEMLEIHDNEMFGECDDPSYVSGRIFAVLDRLFMEHDNKGLTKEQFEFACNYPFDMFKELVAPALDYIDSYLQLSFFIGKLVDKLGTTEEGLSKMPEQLDKKGKKMFIQGFEDMYNSMTHEALEFDQKRFEAMER